MLDYDYIKNNHDYNRDYICLETSSERKQNPSAWFEFIYFSGSVRYKPRVYNLLLLPAALLLFI